MQAKRSLLCRYLKINGNWELIGYGFTENSTTYNPNSDNNQYINEDTERTELKSYAPTSSLSGVIEMTGPKTGPYTLNPVFEYLNEMRRTRSIGNEGEILEIELYTCTSYDSTNKIFKGCKSSRNKVNFQFDEFGGSAGDSTSFGATINYVGDPTNLDDKYDVTDTSARIPVLTSITYHTITYTETNVSREFSITAIDNHGALVENNSDLTAKFVPNSGASLPSTITVTIGGATKTAGTDYTWTQTSGILYIPTNKITGNVVITVTGTT